MIQIELNKELMNGFFFDGLREGKNRFIIDQDHGIAHLTEQEFNQFIKNNNLILYKHTLKQYEDGEIVGSFYPEKKEG